MGRGLWTEWDDDKRAANLAKHGIDFVDVDPCFDGRPMYVAIDRRVDYGEVGENAITVLGGRVMNVAFTRRGRRVRIISARSAGRKERIAYRAFLEPGSQ
jgi:uncharacterized protein